MPPWSPKCSAFTCSSQITSPSGESTHKLLFIERFLLFRQRKDSYPPAQQFLNSSCAQDFTQSHENVDSDPGA